MHHRRLVSARQQPGAHFALALDVQESPILKRERFIHTPHRRIGHLCPRNYAVGFHAACGVDGIAP